MSKRYPQFQIVLENGLFFIQKQASPESPWLTTKYGVGRSGCFDTYEKALDHVQVCVFCRDKGTRGQVVWKEPSDE